MAVLLANSLAAFEAAVGDAQPGLRLLHFRADWAPQCQQMSAVMDELAKDPANAGVVFVNVEAEQVPDIAGKFQISAVPTFVLVRSQPDGRVVEIDRLAGADPASLAKRLAAAVSASAGDERGPDLEQRLRQLISRSPVILFMKGSPEEPRCGFSRQIVAILKENCLGECFDHFDILSDSAVREGLKKFSNWPTYPQLYVKGELVGGLDIVREMAEADELKDMLKSAVVEKLDSLVRQQRVMLFMKGSPEQPRCGFSRQIVQLLKEQQISFGHFDILGDPLVRQALKAHANWPTYPQLYANGSLLGGLDIVREMMQEGELKDALAAS